MHVSSKEYVLTGFELMIDSSYRELMNPISKKDVMENYHDI